MALTMWTYFVINLWIELLMSTPHLVDVAKRHCPYSDFCTIPRAFNFTPTNEVMPCCSQCSCDESCWKLDICCPDIKHVKPPGSQPYTLECTTTRFEYFNKYVEFYLSAYFSYQQYRIITTCPPTYEDTTVVNKCVNSTMFMPETYDDIVVVSDASYHDIIFRNKNCAKCNGVMQIQRWKLITTFCESSPLPDTKLTGPELYQFIISHCDVKSIPSDNVTLTNNALCSDNIISSCNGTDQEDNHDAEIDQACSAFYAPYFEESITPYYVNIYQNVFCYLCNYVGANLSNIEGTESSDAETVSTDDDLCSSELLSRSPFTGQSFSAMLDPSLNLAALEAQYKIKPGLCADNEVYDHNVKICRHLQCPRNSYPYNGRCLSNSLDVLGLPIKFQLTLVPIANVSVNLEAISVKRIGLDLLRKMKLTHCYKCTTLMSVDNLGVSGGLQSVKVEWYIQTDHLCPLDKIEKSIKETTRNKQFNMKTVQKTITTIVRFSYEYFTNDMIGFGLATHLFSLCELSDMSVDKITPVAFCPHIFMNETEFEHYLRITQRASNVTSIMSSESNIIDLKFFKMNSDENTTSPQKYATCIENMLWQRNRGGRMCCSLSIYLCLLEAGIIYFCRTWFQTTQFLS